MPFVNSMRGVHGAQSGISSNVLILDLITGGTITTDGDYRIHTFTTSGTFQTYTKLAIEYLVVGGGGNGYVHPTYGGGGGGGGGVVEASANIYAGPATVVVGGPGTASSIDSNPATPVALNVVANAGTPAPPPGRDSRAGGTSGSGLLGADYADSGYTGGGGGGAGTAAPGPSTASKTGGQGMESEITGTNVWYGGGGAGGGVNRPPYPAVDKCGIAYTQPGYTYPFGVGGIGGGGLAPDNPGVYNGKPNTGGGASGSAVYGYNTQYTGGPGIVVIRYIYK